MILIVLEKNYQFDSLSDGNDVGFSNVWTAGATLSVTTNTCSLDFLMDHCITFLGRVRYVHLA